MMNSSCFFFSLSEASLPRQIFVKPFGPLKTDGHLHSVRYISSFYVGPMVDDDNGFDETHDRPFSERSVVHVPYVMSPVEGIMNVIRCHPDILSTPREFHDINGGSPLSV